MIINVFLEKMTLSNFLHNSSKWDFSVKVKIWRNKNAGRPYASYSTTESSQPKQGPSETLNCQLWMQPSSLFQLQRNLSKDLARDAQNRQWSITQPQGCPSWQVLRTHLSSSATLFHSSCTFKALHIYIITCITATHFRSCYAQCGFKYIVLYYLATPQS